MVALFCFLMLLPQQKAGQSVVQLSFNHVKADTAVVSSLILLKWTDVRKEEGWFEVHIQPAGAEGWKRHEFLRGTKLEVRLAKGFVYSVMVMVKDRENNLIRVSKVRKLKVRL